MKTVPKTLSDINKFSDFLIEQDETRKIEDIQGCTFYIKIIKIPPTFFTLINLPPGKIAEYCLIWGYFVTFSLY